jgi:pimeloyl-ACP methyl ester carboxylesterase
MSDMQPLAFKEFHTGTQTSILFLHGGGVAGWMWQPVVNLLPEFHCIVPDLPEHGESAAVGPFSMALAAEKCAELIHLHGHGGRAVVVGLSEGAQVAVQMLASAPDCISHAMVSSALLLPIPGGKAYANPKLLALLYRWSMSPSFQKDWWVRLNMKYSAGIPSEFFPQFKENFIGMTKEAFVNLMSANQNYRLPQGFEKFLGEVLIVYGRHEYKAMRESARLLARNLTHTRLLALTLGRKSSMAREHNWALTSPRLFADTLRNFIDTHPG